MAIKTVMVENHNMIRREFYCNSTTITPGHLLQRDTTAGYCKVHATAGGNNQRIFAIENDLEGNGISDTYASGEQLQAVQCLPGDVVYALMGSGDTCSIGDYLESNGDGTLQAHVAPHDSSAYIGRDYQEGVVGVARTAGTSGSRVECEVV